MTVWQNQDPCFIWFCRFGFLVLWPCCAISGGNESKWSSSASLKMTCDNRHNLPRVPILGYSHSSVILAEPEQWGSVGIPLILQYIFFSFFFLKNRLLDLILLLLKILTAAQLKLRVSGWIFFYFGEFYRSHGEKNPTYTLLLHTHTLLVPRVHPLRLELYGCGLLLWRENIELTFLSSTNKNKVWLLVQHYCRQKSQTYTQKVFRSST